MSAKPRKPKRFVAFDAHGTEFVVIATVGESGITSYATDSGVPLTLIDMSQSGRLKFRVENGSNPFEITTQRPLPPQKAPSDISTPLVFHHDGPIAKYLKLTGQTEQDFQNALKAKAQNATIVFVGEVLFRRMNQLDDLFRDLLGLEGTDSTKPDF